MDIPASSIQLAAVVRIRRGRFLKFRKRPFIMLPGRTPVTGSAKRVAPVFELLRSRTGKEFHPRHGCGFLSVTIKPQCERGHDRHHSIPGIQGKGALACPINGFARVWQRVLVLIGVRDGIVASPGDRFSSGAPRPVSLSFQD